MDSNPQLQSWIKRLEVKNFRCFSKHVIEFNPQRTIIEGNNGTGKTSLLEALYYGCYLRSFRTANVKDLISFGSSGFFIKIDIESQSTMGSLNSVLHIGFVDGNRHVKVDQQIIKSYKELMNLIRVVSVTETDLLLIQGAPEERRSFVDYAVLLENNDYARALTMLKQTVLNRNACIQKGGRHQDYLIFTEQLWEQSEQIRHVRESYLSKLQSQLTLLIERFFGGQCSLEIIYQSKKKMRNSFEQFLTTHSDLYEAETRMKRSLFGAHQDDILFTYNEKGSRSFASRGQQKLIVLLLKMAQIQLLRQNDPAVAVLFLLDDYMTDLDDLRVTLIMEALGNLNAQLVFTSPIAQSKANQLIVETGGLVASVF